MTSGEFGFEREVIEKFIVDRVLIPRTEHQKEFQRQRVLELFDSVSHRNNEQAWGEVDEWLAQLYGLRKEDLDVIQDTLQYNLPFAGNRIASQRPPTQHTMEMYLLELKNELRPWANRFGRSVSARVIDVPAVSPWRIVRIGGMNEADAEPEPEWPGILDAASSLAASEVIVPTEDGSALRVAKLNQSRYWTVKEARSLSRRIIWEHIDFLGAKQAS
jgi:hypothetical protein